MKIQNQPAQSTIAPAKVCKLLSEVPHESVWLANFISDRTRRTYKNAVREFINFTGLTEAGQLRMIDQAHIIAWRDSLISRGASAKTVNCRISAISSLFKHLCDKQSATKNPTVGVHRPKVDVDRVKTPVITPEQVRAMLDSPPVNSLKGLRDRALLYTLFYTGCRISEVCALRVKDFYEDGGYRVLDFIVKGGKRNRVAINHELCLVINEYLARAGHGVEPDSPLILPVQRNSLRKPLNQSQVNRLFHAYARKAGLPDGVTPHTARATFITQALERKCPIEAVQRSVGHAKIVTTQMYDKRLLKHRESASFAVRY